jgi:hypothetical protein
MSFWDCLGLNYKQIYKELRRSPLPPLPEDFLFGIATADHQCEACVESCRDIRDIWEPEVGREPRGQAADFWNKCFEDVDLARDLGCKAFRFSISWSRVQPKEDEFNADALKHYQELVEYIRYPEDPKEAMEPIVTLHHFAWPTWVNMVDPKDPEEMECPEILTEDFPEIFGRYAKKVAEYIGKDVRYWIPINEPNHLIWGYFKPWWKAEFEEPPGHLKTPENAGIDYQLFNVGTLIRNMYCAHSRAYDEIKKVNPRAMVGSNPYTYGLPYWLQDLFNSNAKKATKGIRTLQEFVDRIPERRLLEGQPRDRGEVDLVIATLTKTSDRECKVNFSLVYFVASQQLMVRSASPAKTAQDLAGEMVAVVVGSTAQLNPPATLQQLQLLAVHDYEMALKMLNESLAEAILADDTILRGLMRGLPGQYRMIDEKLTYEPYAVAVTSGHTRLLAEINKAIDQFKSSGE